MLKDEVPHDANMLGTRFVLPLKHTEKECTVFKARFVVQGHHDRDKAELVDESKNMRQTSIKVVAAMLQYSISTFRAPRYRRITSSQERSCIVRKNIPATNCLHFPPRDLLKMMRPLDGLLHGADYWHAPFASHMKDNLV